MWGSPLEHFVVVLFRGFLKTKLTAPTLTVQVKFVLVPNYKLYSKQYCPINMVHVIIAQQIHLQTLMANYDWPSVKLSLKSSCGLICYRIMAMITFIHFLLNYNYGIDLDMDIRSGWVFVMSLYVVYYYLCSKLVYEMISWESLCPSEIIPFTLCKEIGQRTRPWFVCIVSDRGRWVFARSRLSLLFCSSPDYIVCRGFTGKLRLESYPIHHSFSVQQLGSANE